jgi:hypothetical protein
LIAVIIKVVKAVEAVKVIVEIKTDIKVEDTAIKDLKEEVNIKVNLTIALVRS